MIQNETESEMQFKSAFADATITVNDENKTKQRRMDMQCIQRSEMRVLRIRFKVANGPERV